MKKTTLFFVPDYLKHFSCKMGACRCACCQGWPVSISMENYFQLLGLPCSAELRRRLDGGLHLVDDCPSSQEYARFHPRYDGECSIRLADGRCGLQAELGEEILPDVCCLYPRGVRFTKEEQPGFECSCACSCEAVLELLWNQKTPIQWETPSLSMRIVNEESSLFPIETHGRTRALRLLYIRLMQDRTLSLPARLYRLSAVLTESQMALRKGDFAHLDRILDGEWGEVTLPVVVDDTSLMDGLQVAEKMMETIDQRSDSVRAYGEQALLYFGSGEGLLERYQDARQMFEQRFPDWSIFFEQVLVNHMFYVQFPFQDRPENFCEEFASLCALYTLLRFLSLGIQPDNQVSLIDTVAALFRLVDHSDFDLYTGKLLWREGCKTLEQLWKLICL